MAKQLQLGTMQGFWQGSPSEGFLEAAIEAEKLGYDCVFTAESYGSDVFTPLTWIGAHTSRIRLGTGIAQISARTPASTAMHAMTLDHLSKGRLILGLGVSGPQVVEGWYGMPFAKPLSRTREYIQILRQIFQREAPAALEGEHYKLPYHGEGSWEQGKPLKANIHPFRSDIPILLGAEGPKNVQLAAEECDGWMPLYYSPYRPEVYSESLKNAPPDFEILAPVTVTVTDDIEKGMIPMKGAVSFYVGGMGSRKRNFHKELMARMGFEDEAQRIQDLFLDGKRNEALALVPDAFIDEISLVGSAERIKDRLQAWQDSQVTHLLVAGTSTDKIRAMAELILS